MEWDLHRADPVSSTVEQESSGTYHIHTVDAFGEYHTPHNLCFLIAFFPLDTRHEHLKELRTDKFIGCTLIRHSIVLSAPGTPSVAITIQTLELYRLTHFRCPQLSISAFVKALSDNHSVSRSFHVYCQALLILIHSFDSKDILRASFPSPSMYIFLSALRWTDVLRKPLDVKTLTGASATLVLRAPTGCGMRCGLSSPCYGPWMGMIPLSASFGTWLILKQANGMGLVMNTRILERSQVTCTFHEMK